MKYDCFDDLISLCRLSVVLSKEPTKDGCEIMKKSSKIRNLCITKAQKQFVTQIDREDIVRLACMLHSVNCGIVSLGNYSFLSDYGNFSALIKEGCSISNKCIENKLKIDVESILKQRDELYISFLKETDKQNDGLTFNTKALIKDKFFDKINKCFENIISVIDEIIFISIKNS